jgi:hypothetical protein
MDNMPGFSAEVSLYTSGGHYRSNRNSNTVSFAASAIGVIHAAAAMVGEEVIEIVGEAPWGLPMGWGPGGWVGSGGGTTPTGPREGGGGGPGAGGSGPRPPKPPKPPLSSCGYPPLHCSGPASIRGVYPGCDVTCPEGQTAMCLPGSCFFRHGPVCSCQNKPYIPE